MYSRAIEALFLLEKINGGHNYEKDDSKKKMYG